MKPQPKTTAEEMDVKRIFFISEDRARWLRKFTDNPWITHKLPAYELMDGSILYADYGFPADGEGTYDISKLSK